MTIWILNFGEGMLAVNYLIFAAAASLGMLQFVAGRERLVGLTILPGKITSRLGLFLLAVAYVWFFAVQPDLFIPGLAGGEFFTLFAAGFALAVLISIILGIIRNRIAALVASPRGVWSRELVQLSRREKGLLWLPANPNPPLVFALREISTDRLDVLAGELVARGAAVLLCRESGGEAALRFAEINAGRFHPARRYAVGVGRGADRVLQWAAGDNNLHSALALGPYGNTENARPGLRWLRETDYLSALGRTLKGGELAAGTLSPSACVVYGDEDTLIPPAKARMIYPSALMVAGARHFTLAGMTATRRLAADLFELHAASAEAAEHVAVASPVPEGGAE